MIQYKRNITINKNERCGKTEFRDGKALQPWCRSDGHWNFLVKFAYLIYRGLLMIFLFTHSQELTEGLTSAFPV